MVGSVSYTLLQGDFHGSIPHQCLNDCVYTVAGTSRPKFCFEKDDLPTELQTSDPERHKSRESWWSWGRGTIWKLRMGRMWRVRSNGKHLSESVLRPRCLHNFNHWPQFWHYLHHLESFQFFVGNSTVSAAETSETSRFCKNKCHLVEFENGMRSHLFHLSIPRYFLHTSYLSFLLHRQDFSIPNFYTQKQCKTPENYNKYPQKV